MFKGAENLFKNALKSSGELSRLHLSLTEQMPLVDTSDLLRFQWVYAVSAFDRLMHDLIRIGMLGIFENKRTATKKYQNEAILLNDHISLIQAQDDVERTMIFEKIIVSKMQTKSFQQPDKIADGLSFIWDEKQKWSKISEQLSIKEKDVISQLSLIVTRRNAIVHEADTGLYEDERTQILIEDSCIAQKFINDLGLAIVKCVSSSN